MKKFSCIVILLGSLFSCIQENNNKDAVARVYDSFLFEEDIALVFPQNLSKEDSILFRANYINAVECFAQISDLDLEALGYLRVLLTDLKASYPWISKNSEIVSILMNFFNEPEVSNVIIEVSKLASELHNIDIELHSLIINLVKIMITFTSSDFEENPWQDLTKEQVTYLEKILSELQQTSKNCDYKPLFWFIFMQSGDHSKPTSAKDNTSFSPTII